MQNFLMVQEKLLFPDFLTVLTHFWPSDRKTQKDTHDLKGCQLGLPRILLRVRVRFRVRVRVTELVSL